MPDVEREHVPVRRPMRGSRLLSLFASLVLGTLIAHPAAAGPQLSSAGGPDGLNRWFGLEGGISCLGGFEPCSDFAQAGLVYGMESGTEVTDPDGVVRRWPARTGSTFAMPSMLDPEPTPGHLVTSTPFPGGTVSFAMRIHTLPLQPVVFYEHTDTNPSKRVTLTLTPTGQVVASTSSSRANLTAGRLQIRQWHSIGLTYGPSASSPFKMYLDGEEQFSTTLALGGPGGHVGLGIVQPVTFPYHLGIDDYVEVTKLNAPILGARVGYLIPHGPGGRTEWSKPTNMGSTQPCFDAAENWQLVSEDQRVEVGDQGCRVDGHGLHAGVAGTTDEYVTEGIPSVHQPSTSYSRVPAEPGKDDRILSVRPVVKIRAPFELRISIVDAGAEVTDRIGWGLVSNNAEYWTTTDRVGHTVRPGPGAGAWTPQALGAARLRLTHAWGEELRPAELRLDYVWVPAA